MKIYQDLFGKTLFENKLKKKRERRNEKAQSKESPENFSRSDNI